MDLDKYCQVFPTEQVADGIASLHAQLGVMSQALLPSLDTAYVYTYFPPYRMQNISFPKLPILSAASFFASHAFSLTRMLCHSYSLCVWKNVINESWITNSAPHEVSATLFGVGPTSPLFIQTHVRFQMVNQHH